MVINKFTKKKQVSRILEMKINRVNPLKFFHHLPPTAVPVLLCDFKSGIRAMADPLNSHSDFISALENSFGIKKVFLTSSGRAALLMILLTLKQRSDRLEVILPAYTCPTVAQTVLQAGLQTLFCDVNPKSLSLDRDHLSSLLTEKVLAIIPTHLYGLVQDITDLIAQCKDQGIFIVEDAAQAFGASISGKSVGCAGDFGFFSLGFGKCVPTGHGGVLCAKDDFATDLINRVNELTDGRSKSGLFHWLNIWPMV